MIIEDKLKEYILSKYKSIRAFTQEADLPYSTVDTMFKRGIMGMSVQNVINMCNTLSIDINKLAEGVIEPIKKSIMLDVNEFNLINQYRALDDYGQQLMLDVAKHEYNRCESLRNDGLILTTVAARSENDEVKIHKEWVKDLSKFEPDNDNIDL